MRKIFLFIMVSLDGYFEGENHDLSWHNVDLEFNEFAINQLSEADTILFGKRTYQLMESYWPTKQGREDDPEVATLMNNTKKIVVSNSLKEIKQTDTWKNVTILKNDVVEEIKNLKKKKGKDIIVLASNNLCLTLIKNKLLDEIRIMMNPVVIGKGTPLFYGINEKVNFKLKNTKVFKSGNTLLYLKPN